jgi:hypothetical protein
VAIEAWAGGPSREAQTVAAEAGDAPATTAARRRRREQMRPGRAAVRI